MRTRRNHHSHFVVESLEKREVFDTSLAGVPSEILAAQADIQSTVQADFNGDGRADLAIASGRDLLILLGRASGGFASPITTRLGVAVGKLAVAQLNGDARPDLVALGGGVDDTQRSVLRALVNNGNGQFSLADRAYVPSDGTSDASITARNLTGDARSEIIVTSVSNQTGTMRMFRFGPGGFNNGVVLSTSGAAFVQPIFYDFDRDGDIDIITARNEPARGPQIGRVVGLALTGASNPTIENVLASREGWIDSVLFGNLGQGRGNRLMFSFREPVRQSQFITYPGDTVVQAVHPTGENAVPGVDELARFTGGESAIFGYAIERRINLLGVRDSNTDGVPDVIAESRQNIPRPNLESELIFVPQYLESSLVQLIGGQRDHDGRMTVVQSHSIGGAGDTAQQYTPRYLLGQFAGGPADDLVIFNGTSLSLGRGDTGFKAPVISRIESADILPAVVGAFGFKLKGVFDPDEVRSQLSRGSVQSVHAYFDSNNNGRIDAGDRLLAIDSNGSDGWTFGGVHQRGETARSFLVIAYDDRGVGSRVISYPANVPPDIDLTPLL